MEAVIPGKSLLLFSKVIQCLTKIGEDLYFDATVDKLILRALNQSRSAYFCFTFPVAFFDKYDLDDRTSNVRCKIALKSCSTVFRSLEKVESCCLRLEAPIETALFELRCKLGVVKRYRLDVEESEPLQAVYDKSRCPHRFALYGAILSSALGNFANALDEITLGLDTEALLLRSHIEISPSADSLAKKPLFTELLLNPHDLVAYDVRVGPSQALTLTVALKDLRAVCSFSERQSQPLLFYADEEGRPLLCSISVPGTFEADFVLATLGADARETASALSEDPSPSAPPSDASHSTNSSSVLGKRIRAATPSSNHTSQAVKRARVEDGTAVSTSHNPNSELAEDTTSSGAVLWTRRAQANTSEDGMELEEGDVPDSEDEARE